VSQRPYNLLHFYYIYVAFIIYNALSKLPVCEGASNLAL